MDCKTAKENINIFDSLSQKDKDEVLAHAGGCRKCQRELISSAKLMDELSNLDELEAPEGLAQSAIAKAKKKVKFPPYAYISVAAAAVIAVAFFATSSILGPRDQMSEGAMPMAANEQSLRTNDDAFGAAEEEAVMAADMAEESVETAPEMAMEATAADEANDESDDTAADGEQQEQQLKSEMCYIYVSSDNNEFADEVNSFLSDAGIYFESKSAVDEKQVLQFVVGEMYLSEFEELLQQYEIEYEGTLLPGTLIEITIEQ